VRARDALVYHRRAMRLTFAALLVLVALAISAPAAPAQSGSGGAFGPLPQAQPAETATPAPVKNTTGGDVKRQTLFLIAAGVVVVFAGLGVMITRDARRNLTDEDRARLEGVRTGPPLRKQDMAKMKQRQRAKTRAQRQARKKTRRAGR
jgi:hypothetical protein